MTKDFSRSAVVLLAAGLLTTTAMGSGWAHAAEQSAAAPATSDFDGDGTADLVAGTPQSDGGRGSVTVIPGGPDGPVASAKRTLTEDSAGLSGETAEDGDGFGTSSAWGDVNGDGYADLVVGAPGEDDAEGHLDSGAVTVLLGPGLDTGKSLTAPAADRRSGDRAGTDVAVADFDADGKADVLTVAPGRPAHWWLFDGATGDATSWEFGSTYDENAPRATSLAVGDFNGDGYPDAVSNYRDTDGNGRVATFKGSAAGLERVGGFTDTGAGSAAAGDVDGDGYDDLVIGAPDPEPNGWSTGGQVRIIRGTADGLTVDGATTVHQATAGVPGAAESGDRMGASVSVADYDHDGCADILTGLPGEDLNLSDGTVRADVGSALLLKGSSAGVTGAGAQAFSQATAGVPGAAESGDRTGSAVTLADFGGDGLADAAIGIEGENADDGTILQLDNGSSGLSASSGVYYGRPALGTPAGARLGQTLAP